MYRNLKGLVLVLPLIFSACSTLPDKSANDFTIIFERGYECFAAIERDNLIYMTKASSNTDRARMMYHIVYNPASGVLARGMHTYSKSSCGIVKSGKIGDYTSADIIQITDQHVIDTLANFREANDDVRSALKSIMYNSKYKGNRLNIKKIGTIAYNSEYQYNIDEYLRLPQFNNSEKSRREVADITKTRIKEEEKKKEEAMRQQAEFNRKQAHAKSIWENRFSTAIEIGDKVCTYNDNLFGYIEKIEGQKVKILVVGQPNIALNGFFFSGIDGSFGYKEINKYRWLDVDNVAHCQFK